MGRWEENSLFLLEAYKVQLVIIYELRISSHGWRADHCNGVGFKRTVGKSKEVSPVIESNSANRFGREPQNLSG